MKPLYFLLPKIQYILYCFGLKSKIRYIKVLQECDVPNKTRLIYAIDTVDGKKWVCRLTRELGYSKKLVEKQSAFAMLLYKHGIYTAKKLKNGSNYCMDVEFDGKFYCASVEEFIGQDVKKILPNLFFEFGKILGKSHAISERYPINIPFSVINNAILLKKAQFDSLINNSKIKIPISKEITLAKILHDDLVQQITSYWNKLPHGAVHGDLGIYNNLVDVNGKLGIIDFNLAGDEVFLGDMLIAFYSSIHKYNLKYDPLNKEIVCSLFLRGYLSERELHLLELQKYSEVAALFDGLYFCKSLIEEWNLTKNIKILSNFSNSEKFFDPHIHQFPVQ